MRSQFDMISLFVWIFLPIAFCLSSNHGTTDSDYAYPRVLILGPTGVGKSSLANVLAGCAPGECLFPVCTSINSCTKNTSIVQAKFIGNFSEPDVLMKYGNMTTIDTPGFGDGDLEEPKLVREMVHVLKEDLKWANLIVLCFDGIRWDAQIKAMLETLETLFGENIWRNTIIEVTKWSFHEKDIQDRKRRGITEEDTLLAINNQLKKNFHLNHSLPGVFLDSFAVYYPDDEVQTRFFLKYSSMLWEAALDRKPFSFDVVEQVQVGKISACGIDIDCCKNLTISINELNDRLDHFNERLNDNTMKIVDNKLEIQTNKKQTDTNTDNIDSNANEIDSNTHSIATNSETIDTLIETTSNFVSYCGYQNSLYNTGTVTYDRLFTNMNSFATGGLDAATGVFSPPTQGTYLVTLHLTTLNAGHFSVFFNLHGRDLSEGSVYSYAKDDDWDNTGSTITLKMTATDKLYLHATRLDHQIEGISFCINLLK